ncbi:cullin homolog 1 [Drosophila ficusphila]|uniref:cullin homolog 1 n=1 Tax=Drosophila ficusphila TaxID=30025 RepID=UPI0007E6584F|nr:cullin homolog 1 [Drosophila ficusphila]
MNRTNRRRDYIETLEDFWRKESVFLEKIFDKRIPLYEIELMQFEHVAYLHCSSLVGNPSVRSQDPGRHLYESLTLYIDSRLRDISNELETFTNDEQLVIEYVCYWRDFSKGCEQLDRACGYLNRNWVKREQSEGHDHVHKVYRMAMIRWKELVFSPIDSGLVTAITLLLRQNVRRSVLYQALQSIVELYANDPNQDVPVPKKLENVFTADVVRFYKSETRAELQRIAGFNAYSEFKHFLKYACLAMPEIEKEDVFRRILMWRSFEQF